MAAQAKVAHDVLTVAVRINEQQFKRRGADKMDQLLAALQAGRVEPPLIEQ